jgi:hypothetical protein
MQFFATCTDGDGLAASWVGMPESAIRSRFTVQRGFTLAKFLIHYDSKCEEQRRSRRAP